MDELEYQVAITFINGIGPVLARNLVAYSGGVKELFHERKSVLEKIPGIGRVLADEIKNPRVLEAAKHECEFMAKNRVEPIYFTSSAYPRRLSNCDDAPLMLYKRGNCDLNSGKFLSVVGTRTITQDGIIHCEKILSELANQHPDLVVVSGLAYGVDIVAHRIALSSGIQTVACLGHGLDKVYPYLHTSTAYDIEKSGAMLTEYPRGTRPDKHNFVKRNRIIAGISQGLLVVESGEKGGSLISAKLAADYSREVMALPGRINDAMSKGCNMLIKANIASLVEEAKDIEFQMGWESITKVAKPKQLNLFSDFKSDEERLIYSLLETHKEVDVNKLALLSSLPIYKVTPILLSFEFDELIKMLPGNCVRFIV